MPLILNGATSGSTTIQATDATTQTITLPAQTGTVMVNGPAFSYYQSSAQTLSSSTTTKITFTSSEFDTTSGMFASSRFTPTVAGYYQFTAGFGVATTTCPAWVYFYKNGGSATGKLGNYITAASGVSNIQSTALIYCNGSTDYIEVYGGVGTGQALGTGSSTTYFTGILVRGA
jgi:hypothetical protein